MFILETKMATRISTRRRKQVHRLIDDLSSTTEYLVNTKKKNKKEDKTFYDVTIKEIHETKGVKVHYVGYGEEYDEWKPLSDQQTGDFPVAKFERLKQPDHATIKERSERFCIRLYLEIKRNLHSQRKTDPNVRIQLAIEQDIFEQFNDVGVSSDKNTRQILHNNELERFLGRRLDVRVRNNRGDFESVVEGSVRFWKHERPPMDDFFSTGGKFFPYKIEQEPLFIFTFVRETGNSRLYFEKFL